MSRQSTRQDQHSGSLAPEYHPYSIPSPWAEPPERTQPFACHFYRHNPIQYEQCQSYKLTRVSDITQHFSRRHKLPEDFVCYACRSFPFSQSENLQPPRTDCRHDEKLSSEELRQLSQIRAPDDRSRWYAIWHRLFPLHPAPVSPYLSPAMMEAISCLRVVFEPQLPQVREFLDNAFDLLCIRLPRSRHRVSDDSDHREIRGGVTLHPVNTITGFNTPLTPSSLWVPPDNEITSITSPIPSFPPQLDFAQAPGPATPGVIINSSLPNGTFIANSDFPPFSPDSLD